MIATLEDRHVYSLRRIRKSAFDLYARRRAIEYLALDAGPNAFEYAVRKIGKASGDTRLEGLTLWYRSTLDSLARKLRDRRAPAPRYGRRRTVYPTIRAGRTVISRAGILAIGKTLTPLNDPCEGRPPLFDRQQVVAALRGEPLPPSDTGGPQPGDLLTVDEIAAEAGVTPEAVRRRLRRLSDPRAEPVVVTGIEHLRRSVLDLVTPQAIG
ncbi:hypothetical protein HFP15_15715 [Amycolatopsis sp. K13G38]|uniref:Winged helix-turn-helix transcriptional regulator n=1 Tax=Amycolatopsis acididurans TaxID=2724524 RepID=A0ABX1J3G8_9PSEU|nr:hypothetical protein [Amycolatopsis acididurans]NKQ54333.1 hypothetical protein [Amycolatopsis acididurans]